MDCSDGGYSCGTAEGRPRGHFKTTIPLRSFGLVGCPLFPKPLSDLSVKGIDQEPDVPSTIGGPSEYEDFIDLRP